MLKETPSHVSPERVVDIDIYAPPGGERDIHEAWKTLHAEGRPEVVWTPRNGGHWIVTRYEPMMEVYQDYKRFSSRVGNISEGGYALSFIPASLDPPRHRSFRTLLNGCFAPKLVETSRARVREIAGKLIDGFKDKGQCGFQADYANHLPVLVFMEMMDLPHEDAVQIKFCSDQITRLEGHLTMAEAEAKFFEYLTPVIEERFGSDRTDVITRLINSPVDGQPMARREQLELTSQVLQGGVETVINFLGFAIRHLAMDDAARRELAAYPERIPAATNEMFRRYGIVINAREIAQDTDLAGAQLKAGETIAMPNMLAGMDERVNPDPMRFDLDRPAMHHLTFGGGSHRCPGAPLARIEVEATIEEWLKRIPEFALAPGAAPTYKSGVTPCVDEIPLVWAVG